MLSSLTLPNSGVQLASSSGKFLQNNKGLCWLSLRPSLSVSAHGTRRPRAPSRLGRRMPGSYGHTCWVFSGAAGRQVRVQLGPEAFLGVFLSSNALLPPPAECRTETGHIEKPSPGSSVLFGQKSFPWKEPRASSKPPHTALRKHGKMASKCPLGPAKPFGPFLCPLQPDDSLLSNSST